MSLLYSSVRTHNRPLPILILRHIILSALLIPPGVYEYVGHKDVTAGWSWSGEGMVIVLPSEHFMIVARGRKDRTEENHVHFGLAINGQSRIYGHHFIFNYGKFIYYDYLEKEDWLMVWWSFDRAYYFKRRSVN